VWGLPQLAANTDPPTGADRWPSLITPLTKEAAQGSLDGLLSSLSNSWEGDYQCGDQQPLQAAGKFTASWGLCSMKQLAA
jgi:hypothetical protein